MPHLRFRAVSLDTLKEISAPLLADLCALTGGKPEFVTMERVESHWVRDGELESGFPFVELHWFARPQEIQNAAASLITRHLKAALGEQTYVVVQVFPIDKRVVASARDQADFANSLSSQRVGRIRLSRAKILVGVVTG